MKRLSVALRPAMFRDDKIYSYQKNSIMLKRGVPLLKTLFNSSRQLAVIQCSKRNASLYEPPYLELMKSKYPTYDVLNVKITGYDYPILESYQRFVHRIAESLEFDVSECWAHPPKKTRVVRYKPNSSNIESEYNLTKYERYIQISDVLAPVYPVFLRFIQSGLPEGVTLSVVHHTDFIEESRYVPDKELLDLKAQLEAAGGPITKGRR